MVNVNYKFKAKDGSDIEVRPMEPDDVPHLVDLFDNMGLESRYTRFNMSLPTPDIQMIVEEAAEMTDFERPESDGWLAFADLPGEPETAVAGIRYIHTAPGEAEIALSVRDDMQNKGIGTALFLYMLEEARKSGIKRLVGLAQRNNRPLFRLLNNVKDPIHKMPEGSYVHLVVEL